MLNAVKPSLDFFRLVVDSKDEEEHSMFRMLAHNPLKRAIYNFVI